MRGREPRRRGRPRSFDIDAALETGQRMFQASGYDGVSLGRLTSALGIAAPSFYAAFGSKAAYFQRTLNRYAGTILRTDEIFVEGQSIALAIEMFLVARAVSYSEDAKAKGCLALEATRNCSDANASLAAELIAETSRLRVRDFVASTRPDLAESVSDFVISVMHGMSAHARQGWSTDRLVAAARIAAMSIGSVEASRVRDGS